MKTVVSLKLTWTFNKESTKLLNVSNYPQRLLSFSPSLLKCDGEKTKRRNHAAGFCGNFI